jgi:hypothetical protein
MRVRRVHVVVDRVGGPSLEAAAQQHRALDEKGQVGEDDQEQRENGTRRTKHAQSSLGAVANDAVPLVMWLRYPLT